MQPDRWEHGSDFHVPDFEAIPEAETSPWTGRGVMYASGRDALRALLRHGRAQRGWRRLLVPSFLCQEVVSAARSELPVAVYPDRPTLGRDDRHIEASAGDAVLNVAYFGLRGRAWTFEAPPGAEVIEDHTHDPWSEWALTSCADFCLASLRKTLPVPDGSALWSPSGHALPDAAGVSRERARASADKLAAMLLKRLYLAGHAVHKEEFRKLTLAGEEHIASGDISGMVESTRALMATFPLRAWRTRRRENFELGAGLLAGVRELRVLKPEPGAEAFSLLLELQTAALRDHVRSVLIATRVYPSVLWPLETPAVAGVGAEDLDLSRRVLSLHSDFRYGAGDLERVTDTLKSALTERT